MVKFPIDSQIHFSNFPGIRIQVRSTLCGLVEMSFNLKVHLISFFFLSSRFLLVEGAVLFVL